MHFEKEFKQKMVRLHLEEGRTLKSLSDEYGVSKASISIWVRNYCEECQTNQETKDDYDYMLENRKLHKQLEEMQKENQFLKKQRHSLRRKSINGLSIHSGSSRNIWCTDFTYLYLTNGRKRYNYTLIDLYDRSEISQHEWQRNNQ